MRPLVLLACCLAATACHQHEAEIDIPTARGRAALALSAFECSHLASEKAETSRLFNLGLGSGREFLAFADANPNGYKSIQGQIDPVWTAIESRPSVDFKLGELYTLTTMKMHAARRRGDDWRQVLYQQKNCAFVVAPAAKKT